MKQLIKASIILLCFISSVTFAQQTVTEANADTNRIFADSLKSLHHQWGKVNYTLTGDEQEKAFEKLDELSIAFSKDFSQRAEVWVWRGIVQSSFAGAKGGFGALSMIKEAKKSLEKAIAIDGNVLLGSAFTSLGTLYHKVPGWPIAFGDDDAKKYLEKALAIDPNGIDPNYFYGELMYDKRKYQQAKKHLLIAKNSPVIYSADVYRKTDIDLLIRKVDKKLKRKDH